MALDDLFREAAAKGLTHFSLSATPSADGRKTYWSARAAPSSGHSYVQAADPDPVRATELVLEALPRAKKRQPKDGVTATVKEPVAALDHPELDSWLPKP
jgi:hypothetical protein